jgi:hypothetical protein
LRCAEDSGGAQERPCGIGIRGCGCDGQADCARQRGYGVGVFGEWDGEYLLPLALTAEGEFSILVKE